MEEKYPDWKNCHACNLIYLGGCFPELIQHQWMGILFIHLGSCVWYSDTRNWSFIWGSKKKSFVTSKPPAFVGFFFFIDSEAQVHERKTFLNYNEPFLLQFYATMNMNYSLAKSMYYVNQFIFYIQQLLNNSNVVEKKLLYKIMF